MVRCSVMLESIRSAENRCVTSSSRLKLISRLRDLGESKGMDDIGARVDLESSLSVGAEVGFRGFLHQRTL